MLPKVVFIKSEELKDVEYLMYTAPPFIIARAYKFESSTFLNAYIKNKGLKGYSEFMPKGYNILILWHGTIDNVTEAPLPIDKLTEDQKRNLLLITKMYVDERITAQPKRYEKFKEK
jgi:hypothetical protein